MGPMYVSFTVSEMGWILQSILYYISCLIVLGLELLLTHFFTVVFKIQADFFENVGRSYMNYVSLMRHVRRQLVAALHADVSQIWNVIGWEGMCSTGLVMWNSDCHCWQRLLDSLVIKCWRRV